MGYDARVYYQRNPELKAVLDWLRSDVFTPAGELTPLVDSVLLHGDPFFVAADYEAYCQAQDDLDKAYSDKPRWARMAIMNTARVGKFSSDRTISEYARDIWNLEPIRPPAEPMAKAAQ
jgi:starch phosphorylase